MPRRGHLHLTQRRAEGPNRVAFERGACGSHRGVQVRDDLLGIRARAGSRRSVALSLLKMLTFVARGQRPEAFEVPDEAFEGR